MPGERAREDGAGVDGAGGVSPGLGMATRTETELGWPEILAALAARCRLPAGRRAALALPLHATAADAREALARVGEARKLSEAAFALPLGGVGDVEAHLDRASRGGVLEPVALRECAAL